MFRFLLRVLLFLASGFMVIFFPFIALIRGAVYLHEEYGLWAWVSLLGGMVASALVLFIYLVVILGRFTGRLGSFRTLRRRYWLALALILVYVIPAVSMISNRNTKHDEVRKEFRSLHPILRVGISTLVLLDRSLLITDANRVPEDYRKMGLPTKSASLHYKQSDGFSHAVDLRTRERTAVHNWLVKNYFKLMGFNTLRHIGTADHLHVSLMSHDRPGGI